MNARSRPAGQIRQSGQVALGAMWLIDGALQFQPFMFGRGFVTGVILPNAARQPGIVASPLTWMAHDIQPHVALFNALAGALQVVVGLALMSSRTAKPALAISFIWAGLIWFAGEGFGGLLTGAANPLTGAPGAALLYIVVGAMVWPRASASASPAPSASPGTRASSGAAGSGGRVAWAALWLGSAALWLLPANDGAGSVHNAVAAAPSGAGWLTSVLNAVATAASGHGTAIALTLSALSAFIALSALTRVAERTSIALAIILSLAFWVAGQGLGGILTGMATDVSTAPLVVLMGCLLLARRTAVYAAAPATSPSSPAAGARIAAPSRSLSSAFSPEPRSTR